MFAHASESCLLSRMVITSQRESVTRRGQCYSDLLDPRGATSETRGVTGGADTGSSGIVCEEKETTAVSNSGFEGGRCMRVKRKMICIFNGCTHKIRFIILVDTRCTSKHGRHTKGPKPDVLTHAHTERHCELLAV
jgi:hypothetical protein